jgi:WD40 repeat protein
MIVNDTIVASSEITKLVESATDKKKLDRYPGLRPFTVNDSFIFFGRDTESEILMDAIRVNPYFILYGRSGLGKSSLINAALVPKLVIENFLPVIIRFYNPGSKINTTDTTSELNNEPSLIIANEIIKVINCDISRVMENDRNDPLALIKYLPPKKTLLLIFDQFEEFLYYDKTVRERAIQLIHSIIHNGSSYNGPANYPVKLLFLIRSDRFYLMKEVSKTITGLLNCTYELTPLSIDKAEQAIELPVQINLVSAGEHGEKVFKTDSFRYDLDALKVILDTLSNKEGEIESSQLQIVCQEIEDIAFTQSNTSGDTKFRTINAIDFKGAEGIKEMLNKFYSKQLEKLGGDKDLNFSTGEIRQIRIIIEDELVRNNKRVVQSEDSIREEIKKIKPSVTTIDGKDKIDLVIDKLLGLRLIREEDTHLGKVYEISHDTLLESIIQSKTDRLKKDRERKIRKTGLLYGMIPVALSMLLLFFYLERRNKSLVNKQAAYLSAASRSLHINPTLSYIIARKGYDIYQDNNSVNKLIDSIEKNYTPFITKRMYLPQGLEGVFMLDNNKLVAATTSELFSSDSSGKISSLYNTNNSLIYASRINGKGYYMEYIATSKDDTCKLKTTDGKLITQFLAKSSPRTIAVSDDLSMVVINGAGLYGYLYKKDSLKSSTQLDRGDSFNDLMTMCFTHNNKYIIAGYWSGHIVVYNTKGEWLKSFMGGNRNSAVSTLAVTGNDKYLVSGDRENNIYIWELGNLDSLKPVNTITPTKEPYRKFEGHLAEITSLAISPDNKWIASGSADHNVILWDFNGKIKSVLRGHKTNIDHIDFVTNDKIVTSSTDGEIMTWEAKNAADLYHDKRLETFSPFDYYALGLENCSGKADSSGNLEDKITRLVNDAGLLPGKNIYPEDDNYLASISKSITELEGSFQKIFNDPGFKDISPLSKRLIKLEYAEFQFREKELLLETNTETLEQRQARDLKYQAARFKAYLDDTSMFVSGIIPVDNIIGVYFLDTLANSHICKSYIDSITMFFDAYLEKNKNQENITNIIADRCYTLAGSFFYQGNLPKAEELMERSLSLYKNPTDYALTNLDTRLLKIYLALGKIEKAKQILQRLWKLEKICEGYYTEDEIKEFVEQYHISKLDISRVRLKAKIKSELTKMKNRKIGVKEAEEFGKYLELFKTKV